MPKWICEAFSKRSWESKDAGRALAQKLGLDWDALSPDSKAAFLRGGARYTRNAKEDERSDFAEWHRQAADLNYRHRSVLHP